MIKKVFFIFIFSVFFTMQVTAGVFNCENLFLNAADFQTKKLHETTEIYAVQTFAELGYTLKSKSHDFIKHWERLFWVYERKLNVYDTFRLLRALSFLRASFDMNGNFNTQKLESSLLYHRFFHAVHQSPEKYMQASSSEKIDIQDQLMEDLLNKIKQIDNTRDQLDFLVDISDQQIQLSNPNFKKWNAESQKQHRQSLKQWAQDGYFFTPTIDKPSLQSFITAFLHKEFRVYINIEGPSKFLDFNRFEEMWDLYYSRFELRKMDEQRLKLIELKLKQFYGLDLRVAELIIYSMIKSGALSLNEFAEAILNPPLVQPYKLKYKSIIEEKVLHILAADSDYRLYIHASTFQSRYPHILDLLLN